MVVREAVVPATEITAGNTTSQLAVQSQSQTPITKKRIEVLWLNSKLDLHDCEAERRLQADRELGWRYRSPPASEELVPQHRAKLLQRVAHRRLRDVERIPRLANAPLVSENEEDAQQVQIKA